MITKLYATEIKSIISNSFNNAVVNENVPERDTAYAIVNGDAPYIRVGSNNDYQDFANFKDAAAYANSRKGEFFVGIRLYKKMKAIVVATINQNN